MNVTGRKRLIIYYIFCIYILAQHRVFEQNLATIEKLVIPNLA